MSAARPVLEAIGTAMSGREVVMVAGNHDHALLAPWLMRRMELERPPRLGLEQRLDPAECSPLLETLSGWAGPASLKVAYPGLWVRPDVFAMHGHYLDCHLTVPTMERIAIAATGRVLGLRPQALSCVEDHEAITAPVFAWIDAIAGNSPTGAILNGSTTVRMWRALGGGNGAGARSLPRRSGASFLPRLSPSPALRRRALAAAFPLAVAALNRGGFGPLRAKISTGELRRAGLRAMGEVAARLDLGDAHVVFGHTHRAGPLAEDVAQEWIGPSGARLTNTGSWTYSDVFLGTTPGQSPYWPGSCVVVEDSGPPKLRRLLLDHSHSELAAALRGIQRSSFRESQPESSSAGSVAQG